MLRDSLLCWSSASLLDLWRTQRPRASVLKFQMIAEFYFCPAPPPALCSPLTPAPSPAPPPAPCTAVDSTADSVELPAERECRIGLAAPSSSCPLLHSLLAVSGFLRSAWAVGGSDFLSGSCSCSCRCMFTSLTCHRSTYRAMVVAGLARPLRASSQAHLVQPNSINCPELPTC